ncbi:MAG: NUDIX domain-containing protein [Oscillospiraceae bacterium]|nr:NUDIX domain-containing protein [Oscillospiraceae bacterium]
MDGKTVNNVEITNMIFIQDMATGKVLAQNRVKNWRGWSFPGGHVEDGESFYASAVREAKEETGLNVRNLKSCGVIHWTNTVNHGRYLTFLYKTSDFDGELLKETKEGANAWMGVDELFAAESDNLLHEILEMFLRDDCGEAFGSWSNDDDWRIYEYL